MRYRATVFAAVRAAVRQRPLRARLATRFPTPDRITSNRKRSRPVLGAALAHLLVLACLLAQTTVAHANIVNVQSLLNTEARDGWSGAFVGAVDWRTGTTKLLLVSAAPVTRYRDGDHLVLAIAKGELGRSAGATIVAKTFEHLRYRYRATKTVTTEAFAQHAYDQFRRLELRTVLGAGPKFDIINQERHRLALGVAYMLEYERISDDAMTADAGAKGFAHRASTYLTGGIDAKDDLRLVATVYAQPSLTNARDLRVLGEAEMAVALSKAFSIKTTFALAWDNRSPEGVEPLETALKSAVSVEF